MKITENQYKILSIILLLAIILMVVFVIIPKYTPGPTEQTAEKIDFSTSAWIENYVEDTIGLFGKDFYLNTAFSYNPRSNKMIVTYASQMSVEAARDHYSSLPGAEQIGRNDETSLSITAEKNGQPLRYTTTIPRFPGYLNWNLFLIRKGQNGSSPSWRKYSRSRSLPRSKKSRKSLRENCSGDTFVIGMMNLMSTATQIYQYSLELIFLRAPKRI